MEVGDLLEFYFKRKNKNYIVFGEVLDLKNEKVRLKIYDSPSITLSDWNEVIIKESDIIRITTPTEVDYSDIPYPLN